MDFYQPTFASNGELFPPSRTAGRRSAGGAFVFALLACLNACSNYEPDPTEGEPQAVQKHAVSGSHLISGVPWYQEMNALFCGPAALQMVLDHFGAFVNQKAVTDVARTTNAGTWCPDMVRVGQFSWNSAAQGSYFQNEMPTAGFADHHLGYGAFEHSQDTPWLSGIKAAVDMDIPVIALVTFDPDGGTGHFRTIVGYDDAQGVLHLLDPWGRDQNRLSQSTGTAVWTYEEFLSSWNYQDALNEHPHWAVAIVPWSVSLSVQGATSVGSQPNIKAAITYKCPPAFDCNAFPASNAAAAITLPAGMSLVQGSATKNIGNLAAGASTNVTWKVQVNQSLAGKSVSVTASGWISGGVPVADSNGQGGLSYPPYGYTDEIGGTGVLAF